MSDENPGEAGRTPRRRDQLLWMILRAVALAVALVVLASLAFDRFIAESPASATPELAALIAEAPAEAEASEVVVARVSGMVERSVGPGWTTVRPNDRLRAEDSIRTGASSSADLQTGKDARVTVADASEMSLRQVTDKSHRLKLVRGRAAVDYGRSAERTLTIENPTTGATVETHGAKFYLLATSMALAVATQSGVVNVSAKQQTVQVREGEQSTVQADGTPSPPEPIPVSLLLKLAAATGKDPYELCTWVEGSTFPGMEVTVDGKSALVSRQGRFSVPVPRRKGLKAVRVVTRDALGRSRMANVPCGAPPQKPENKGRIDQFQIVWDNDDGQH
jgi:hypothetical protein